MSSALYSLADPLRKPLTHRQSVALVFVCTLIGAAAQVFMKIGAHRLPVLGVAGLFRSLHLILLNWPLMLGLGCYGVFTVLLIVALRDGELSILYPVIALNYVWVTILSMLIFGETMNVFKALGITIIIAGVVMLGKGRR